MFSVVIPLYNKEVTIAVTINSILNQKFKDFEVIIVDDGSTDNSLYVVQSFSDSRLKVFSQENMGVSYARNFAIKEAQYQFIAFLDADDKWDPDYLSEMSILIEQYPQCAAYTSAYRVIGPNKTSLKCESLQEGIIDNFFEARFHHHIMRTSATIVRKNAFDVTGGFPEGMIGGEDDYTWAKIALKFKIAFTPKVLATYDNRSSTFNMRRGQMDSCKESWLDLLEVKDFYRNEFVANKAITAGIRYAYGATQDKSLKIEKYTRYTTLYKKKWRYLFLLNRLPHFMIFIIKAFIPIYKKSKFWLARNKNKINYLLKHYKI